MHHLTMSPCQVMNQQLLILDPALCHAVVAIQGKLSTRPVNQKTTESTSVHPMALCMAEHVLSMCLQHKIKDTLE